MPTRRITKPVRVRRPARPERPRPTSSPTHTTLTGCVDPSPPDCHSSSARTPPTVRGYASSLLIATSCSGQSSLTRSRSQPARSPALFDKTRVGSLHVQPNLRASSVPGSLPCGVLNLRYSSGRSGRCPFCPGGCCPLLLTSRAYRTWQVVRNVAAELRLNVET